MTSILITSFQKTKFYIQQYESSLKFAPFDQTSQGKIGYIAPLEISYHHYFTLNRNPNEISTNHINTNDVIFRSIVDSGKTSERDFITQTWVLFFMTKANLVFEINFFRKNNLVVHSSFLNFLLMTVSHHEKIHYPFRIEIF